MSIAGMLRALIRRKVADPATGSGAIGEGAWCGERDASRPGAFRIDEVAPDAGVGEVLDAIRRKLAAARRIA
jgi:hypothetical protein